MYDAVAREAVFWSRVDFIGICWEWTGGVNGRGYGQFGWANGEVKMAHRLARELLGLPVPEGKVLDHFCKNHRCVNPDHTDPVTQKVNVNRGRLPIVAKVLMKNLNGKKVLSRV